MRRGQTSLPQQWVIVAGSLADLHRKAIRRLPSGTGLLLLDARADSRLRLIARQRRLTVREGREIARVHDSREIARARRDGRRPLLLLSPLFETRSHPGMAATPRMRVAALARMAGRPLLALGGMNARRYRAVRALGFDGWAGIDAWGVRT